MGEKSFAELFKEYGMKGFDKGQDFAEREAKGLQFSYPDQPQDSLNLHGMYVKIAVDETEKFVLRSREAGFKKVLVITGKGLHSDGGVAKLRPHVAKLLNRLKEEKRIRDYEFAEQRHGGMGAYYVLF